MKSARILAIVPLALISLMNLGYPLGTDAGPVLTMTVLALALAGFLAVFGLARNTAWGNPAALAVSGVNVAAAVIALVVGSEGAGVGLVISATALALAVVARPRSRETSLA